MKTQNARLYACQLVRETGGMQSNVSKNAQREHQTLRSALSGGLRCRRLDQHFDLASAIHGLTR
jgi:hypothetical protein